MGSGPILSHFSVPPLVTQRRAGTKKFEILSIGFFHDFPLFSKPTNQESERTFTSILGKNTDVVKSNQKQFTSNLLKRIGCLGFVEKGNKDSCFFCSINIILCSVWNIFF